MSRYNVGDGPLHDFAGEAAQARAEAIDRLVDEWWQDRAVIGDALAAHDTLVDDIADLMEYSDKGIGERVRKLVHDALTARAEREIDA